MGHVHGVPEPAHQMKGSEGTPKLYTIQEAAKFLRTSLPTLWRIRREGQISFFRVGNKPLFSQADLDAFLERHRINKDAAAEILS